MKKFLSIMLCFTTMAALLAGCGNNKENESAGTETATTETGDVASETEAATEAGMKEGETITLSGWSDEAEMKGVIEALNQELAGEYVVEYLYTSLSDYNNIINTQLAAGEGPDIISEGTNFPSLIKAGKVKELTGNAFLANFNETGFSLCSDGDKIYGIPASNWFSGVWYNKDIFSENGITEPPKTFDELVEICDKLAANGAQPMGFGLADGDTAMHSMLGFVQNDFLGNTEEGENFDVAFAKGEKMMEGTLNEYVDKWSVLIEKGYINETMVGISNEQALNDFIAGKTAIFNGGPWQYAQIKEAGMNFGMFPNLGTSTENRYLMGGPATSYGINVNTKNEAGAQRVMEALASAPIQQAIVDANPGYSSYHNDVKVELMEEYAAVEDIMNAGNVVAPWDKWAINMPSQTLVNEVVAQLQGVVTGELTTDEFLQALDSKADSIRYE